MLETLRKRQKEVLIALVVVVSVTFVGFNYLVPGSPDLARGEAGEIARVNGQAITGSDLMSARRNLEDSWRSRTGSYPGADEREYFERQALDELIEGLLALQRADAEGVVVTPDDMANRVRTLPAFQGASGFDEQRFQQFVNNPGTDWTRLEIQLRRDIAREKFQAYLQDAVRITEADLDEAVREEAEELTVSYVRISADEFAKPAEIAEARVREYYEDHLDEFRRSGDAEQAAAKKRASDLLARARKGRSFDSLAREHSDDTGSAARGGDVGWFGRGQMVPEFEKAAFAMKTKGELAGPVKTQFGWHVLKLEDRRAGTAPRKGAKSSDEVHVRHILVHAKPRQMELREVEADIRKGLARPAGQPAARARASELLDKIRAGTPFAEIARPHGGLRTAGPFRRSDSLPKGLENASEVTRTAFRLRPGEVSDVVPGASDYFLVRLDARKPGKPAALDRATLRQQLLRQRQRQAFAEWSAAARATAKLTDRLAELQAQQRRDQDGG